MIVYTLVCAECKRPVTPDIGMPKYLRPNDPFLVCVDCFVGPTPHYPPANYAEEV